VIGGVNIETTSPQFVRALAAKLTAARGRRPVAVVALCSRGRFRRQDLRDAEAGLLPLDLATVRALASTYGIDVAVLVPATRSRLAVRPEGLISAGGHTLSFEPGNATSIMTAYVRLLHRARDHDGAEISARDGDVQAMATFLDNEGFGRADRDALRTIVDDNGVPLALDVVDRVITAVEARRRLSAN
jgi:hypothetical protein